MELTEHGAEANRVKKVYIEKKRCTGFEKRFFSFREKWIQILGEAIIFFRED
jgi:hypothetical protein